VLRASNELPNDGPNLGSHPLHLGVVICEVREIRLPTVRRQFLKRNQKRVHESQNLLDIPDQGGVLLIVLAILVWLGTCRSSQPRNDYNHYGVGD
jgi:hypothetical protein